MPSVRSKLREELSFIKGNLPVLIVSYMMFRISGGLIGSFYPYYRELGASPFLLEVMDSIFFPPSTRSKPTWCPGT